MLLAGIFRPLSEPFKFTPDASVSMKPWKYAIPVTVILFSAMVFVFVLFSTIGLASPENIVSGWFFPAVGGLIVITAILYLISLKSWNRKYQDFIVGRHEERVEEMGNTKR